MNKSIYNEGGGAKNMMVITYPYPSRVKNMMIARGHVLLIAGAVSTTFPPPMQPLDRTILQSDSR